MLRLVFGSFAIVLCSVSAFAMGFRSPEGARYVTDSLVNQLRCSTLTRDTVLKEVQPDAFSTSRHLPVRNWASGRGLAECWSLSHAQRLFFYMARMGQASNDPARALDDFSGAYDAHPFVFTVSDLGELYDTILVGGKFRNVIERYEDWRFYQPGNIEFLIGDRDRDPASNAETFARVQGDLSDGRLPVVIIRAGLRVQHAVIIKRLVRIEGTGFVDLEVYNSNTPAVDGTMFYDEGAKEFYAPSITEPFGVDPDPPVGVFLVDEDGMDLIQAALFEYYQGRCRSVDGGMS